MSYLVSLYVAFESKQSLSAEWKW